MDGKKPELLAPAGDKKAFTAALDAGADSVYIGLKAFNARALARNFSPREAADLVAFAHERGKKVFVAMNALVKESELEHAVTTLAQVEAMQADGLIIQDLGILHIARRYFPGLRLHASTLMTIHNSYGVKQAHQMGFKRVVLAREMTIHEIEAAVKAAPIEIEVFIHGAMCFCYSGLCLFSSFMGGRSSTRGKCVQPCRRKYKWGRRQGTFFSMNDLEAGPVVWNLAEIGVDSLKIEGRLRPANYVRHVVSGYRILLDSQAGDPKAVEAARDHFQQALGRPGSKGFFFTPRPNDLISPRQTSNTGLFVGRVSSIKRRCFEVTLKDLPVNKGDRIRLVNKKDQQHSFRITRLENEQQGNKVIIFHELDQAFSNALVFKIDCARKGKDLTAGLAGRPGSQFRWDRTKAANIVQSMDNKRAGRPTARRAVSTPRLCVRLSNIHDIKWFHRANVDAFLIKTARRNIRSFQSLKKIHRDKIVWFIEPIQHESEALELFKAVAQLYRSGAARFEVSNLGHLQMLKEALEHVKSRISSKQLIIYSSHHLNLLNSRALMEAVSLGIDRPQFSIETDMENAENALSRFRSKPVAFTIFSFLPLFHSRMGLMDFKSSSSVISPKGETAIWRSSKKGGRLVAPVPFNATGLAGRLSGAGFAAWVIDLTSCCRETGNLKEIAKRLVNNRPLPKGTYFNLVKGLA